MLVTAALLAPPLKASGVSVYESQCARCHDRGVMGAPAKGSALLSDRFDQVGLEGLMESVHKQDGALLNLIKVTGLLCSVMGPILT